MNLNSSSYKILEELMDGKNACIEEFDAGSVTLLDVGLNLEGNTDTALRVAEATLAGLGRIEMDDNIRVEIEKMPAVATLSSQMAGWCIKMGEGIALGSGPVRILAKKPKNVIEKIGYFEASDKGALILETPVALDRETCQKILEETGVKYLIIAVFSENSMTGLINVLSRVVEVGIFRLFNLGYDVKRILYARGEVPMIELSGNVMFGANDAIIYKGSVELKVNGWDPWLTRKAISKHSSAYGKPFRDIFREAGGNFYNIPADIFAPADLKVTDLGE
jgi:methenyltetrahydromethanopterin cyclohydrolase